MPLIETLYVVETLYAICNIARRQPSGAGVGEQAHRVVELVWYLCFRGMKADAPVGQAVHGSERDVLCRL
jgi:hypothetical protein